MSKKNKKSGRVGGSKKNAAVEAKVAKVADDQIAAEDKAAIEKVLGKEPKAKKAGETVKIKAASKNGKMSGLDAAAKILKDAKKPMDCKAIVEKALASGMWKTKGKTPAATVYAAIIREILKKGPASRFQKTGRGTFSSQG